MSSQDYDELEKMLAGHWKFDRDENLEAFLEAAGMIFNKPKLLLHLRVWSQYGILNACLFIDYGIIQGIHTEYAEYKWNVNNR